MTPGGEQSGTMDKANEAQIKRLDEELMKLQRGHMPCHWQTQPEQFVFARQPEQIVFATCISMPWTQTPENVLAILDRTMAVLEETVCDRGGGGIVGLGEGHLVALFETLEFPEGAVANPVFTCQRD